MTIAAREASGRYSKTPAMNRIVSSTMSDTTTRSNGVFAPASSAAADFERLPVTVYPWSTPAPIEATP